MKYFIIGAMILGLTIGAQPSESNHGEDPTAVYTVKAKNILGVMVEFDVIEWIPKGNTVWRCVQTIRGVACYPTGQEIHE